MALATRSRACVLADDPLAQAIFHGDQFLHFAFEHLRDGNAGPLGDDAGDVFFVHFFFEHAWSAATFAVDLCAVSLAQFFFGLPQQSVTNFGHALQVAFALFGLLFDFQLLDSFFQLAGAGDQILLFFPIGLKGVGFLADSGELLPMTARRSREFASSSFFSACFSISNCVARRSS